MCVGRSVNMNQAALDHQNKTIESETTQIIWHQDNRTSKRARTSRKSKHKRLQVC